MRQKTNDAASFKGDMPSYGFSVVGPTAENHRADEYHILLSDQSHQMARFETVRRVLAADYGDLLNMLKSCDDGKMYDDLRNLQQFAHALGRVTDIAIDMVMDAINRNDEVQKPAAA